MATPLRIWLRKNTDFIQLAVSLAATIIAFSEAIDNPGRMAILCALVVASVGFGVSLAFTILGRRKNAQAVQHLP